MPIRETALGVMLLLGFAVALPAQEITGNISGTVTDTSGSAVPDAKVDLLSVLTGAERSTTSTSAGVFFFTSLPVGDYKITVAKDGFKKSEVTGIHVNVNDRLTFNISLPLGSVTESVTVTSETPVLQTETAEVSNLVGNNQMKSLPLNQRDFGQLVDLVPGVAPDNGRVGIGDTDVSVNGNQSNSNLYLVDGTFDEDNGNNGGIMVRPTVDAIEEFKNLIQLDPSARSYTFLGLSYRHLGRFDEARKYFQEGLKQDPHNASCLFNMGYIEEHQGNHARAEEQFQRALRANPAPER